MCHRSDESQGYDTSSLVLDTASGHGSWGCLRINFAEGVDLNAEGSVILWWIHEASKVE